MGMLSLKRRGTRNGVWYASGFFGPHRVRHSLATKDRDLAIDRLACYEADLISGKIDLSNPAPAKRKNKFKNVARRYISSPRTGNSHSTKQYTLALADHFGDFDIDSIDENDIEEYIEVRHMQKGNSNNSIRRALTQLQSILNFAASLSLRETIKIRKPAEDPHKTDTFTDEEIEAIFPALHPDVRRVCIFLLKTGARPCEATALEYSDIDFTNNSVMLKSYKGAGGLQRGRRVPLHPDALAVIPRSTPLPTTKVFLKEGAEYADTKQIQYNFKAATRPLDIDKTPYALRHTFATKLARKGVPPKVIADLLGHSDLKMVMRYMNTTFEDQVSAVMSL